MTLPEQAAPASPIQDNQASETRKGVAASLGAYLAWGFLPILFHLLDGVSAVNIVAERTIWSLVLLAVLLAFTGGFGEVRALLSDPRRLAVMAMSAAFLACNWLLYVWAVETGQVLEVSFGYFISPLVNVAIGMLILGERQNRLQALAIAIACVAVFIQAAGLGKVPYVALGLAFSFGIYGFIRKTVQAGPSTGLFTEALAMAPFALAYLAYDWISNGPGAHADPRLLALLLFTGPATALPLLLFTYSIRRLRLTTIGMLQYLAPSLQFLLAVFYFHEELNGVRLLSFALIWLSLIVYSYDSLRQRSRARVVAP